MTDGLASLDIRDTLEIPSVTQVTAKLSSLHLEDHESMPGAFSRSSAAPCLSLRNAGPLPLSTETESLETLVTAATLTATPMDTSTHDTFHLLRSILRAQKLNLTYFYPVFGREHGHAGTGSCC